MPRKNMLPLVALALVLSVLLLGSQPARAAGPTVELFVTSWCPYCVKAKAFFDAKGIAYTAHDIEKDQAAAERFEKYGQTGVPLVVINGTPIAGYSVAEFEKALGAVKAAPAHAKTTTGQ